MLRIATCRHTPRAGFDAERVILALTHTHSAAQISPSLTDREGGNLIPEYLAQVEHALEEALRECLRNAGPGLLEAHAGNCALATDHDMREPGGTGFLVGWNREGQADTSVLVGRISRPDGSGLATLVNYACHPTILAWENSRTSPDYPGAMRELVERKTGAPVLFLQGAGAELAPRNQYTADPSVADKAGRCLGHAVLATLADMQTPGHELRFEGLVESGARLGIWRERKRENIPCDGVWQACSGVANRHSPADASVIRSDCFPAADSCPIRRSRVGYGRYLTESAV